MAIAPQTGWLIQADCIPYLTAWQQQQALLSAHLHHRNPAAALWLLEHPPVYTLGTGATLAHLKFDPAQAPSPLYRCDRGGEVTYHCPGQLVGYPVLNLRRYQTDLHWYLRQLEAVLLQVVAQYGLVGERLPGLTGVWVAGRKVAAIGIAAKRWITTHGFALNVCPDLSGFEAIVPCGIGDRPVGSLAEFIPGITLAAVRQQVATCFADQFHLAWETLMPDDPRLAIDPALPSLGRPPQRLDRDSE
ncbi:MAG: lipoyl(octanoyl) transferase LipB [Spirulinaceae cyanobacterium SM2_1_0]|nr:lipoyl(octanoyl) transferase LipB [Spirulinaceae cyanobacterium SM2_1_0]